MTDERPSSAEDDFVFEEHSGETPGDEATGGLELDEFQAREIRQIFLNTLPEYLEPVSQMLAQVLSATDEQQDVRRALQTTLSSISAAASRVGIVDVCAAVDEMRDRLLALDDEPWPPSTEVEHGLRAAFASLQALAGGGTPREVAAKQTIVLALQHVQGFDRGVLERLTSAGLVTVDQLEIADPGEIVAVTGLERAVVDRLLQAVLGDSALSRADERPARKARPPASSPATNILAAKLRSQIDTEATVDELRAEILRVRLEIAALKQRISVAERRRDGLRDELSKRPTQLTDTLARLSRARLEHARLENERDERRQRVETLTGRISELSRDQKQIVEARDNLASAIAGLVHKLTHLRGALDAARREQDG